MLNITLSLFGEWFWYNLLKCAQIHFVQGFWFLNKKENPVQTFWLVFDWIKLLNFWEWGSSPVAYDSRFNLYVFIHTTYVHSMYTAPNNDIANNVFIVRYLYLKFEWFGNVDFLMLPIHRHVQSKLYCAGRRTLHIIQHWNGNWIDNILMVYTVQCTYLYTQCRCFVHSEWWK